MMVRNKPVEAPPGRLLEVIVTSVEDARAAEQGGASRLEVVRNLEVGGLTPSLELVMGIQSRVAIPLRVMVRENPGFEIGSRQEYETLCRLVRAFAALGVDGLVLGFLRDADIDLDSLRGILAWAPGMKITFHRAFEELGDPERAIRLCKSVPQIDRILTSGGLADWQQNVERLSWLQKYAAPEITILVGGGLTLPKLESLCASTELGEFHLGRAVREGSQTSGGVCVDRVTAVVQAIR